VYIDIEFADKITMLKVTDLLYYNHVLYSVLIMFIDKYFTIVKVNLIFTPYFRDGTPHIVLRMHTRPTYGDYNNILLFM